LGLSQKIEGKNLFDFIHPDDLDTAIAPFKASLNNPGETNIRISLSPQRWFLALFRIKSNFAGMI